MGGILDGKTSEQNCGELAGKMECRACGGEVGYLFLVQVKFI